MKGTKGFESLLGFITGGTLHGKEAPKRGRWAGREAVCPWAGGSGETCMPASEIRIKICFVSVVKLANV